MVAVSLALAAAEGAFEKPLLLDCDVEEPNCGLFLDVDYSLKMETGVAVPAVVADRCDFCGKCAQVCVWHAIAVAGEKVLVFPDLCHGCGSCTLSCPRQAISEITHVTGTIQGGSDGQIDFAEGILDVGRAMPVPVISALLSKYLPPPDARTVIIDSSPGTSCPVVEAVGASDFVVLVTEPTPFGLHDLRAAVDVVTGELELPAGVIINRDGIGNDDVETFCRNRDLPILARIPMDRRIATILSEGTPLTAGMPGYRDMFRGVLAFIEGRTRR